jgi:tetratricopeptide (TPR) repeat protein
MLLGRTLLQEGKGATVEQMMRVLLEKQPRSDEAAEVLCRALLAQSKPTEALAAVEEAIKRVGNSKSLLWARADTLAVLKQYDKSEHDYSAAMKSDPKSIPLRMSFVQTLVTAGKTDEGAKLAVETAQLAPNVAEVHFMAGGALYQAGRVDEGLAQYKEALVIKPDMVPAANNLALLLADRNQDTGTAVAWARKAAAAAPGNIAIADTLGWALARDGRVEEALPILREVHSAWKTNPTVWYHYGWALAKSGKMSEGLKWIQQAASSGSDCAAAARKALQELS